MAEVPKSPWEAKTCKSPVIPAPFEGSKPAMVRAMDGLPGREVLESGDVTV